MGAVNDAFVAAVSGGANPDRAATAALGATIESYVAGLIGSAGFRVFADTTERDAAAGSLPDGTGALVAGDQTVWQLDEGVWVDSGVDLATGEAIAAFSASIATLDARSLELQRLFPVDPILVGGRWLQPTKLSFDLYVEAGYWLDTGEDYDPAVESIAAGAWYVESSSNRLDIYRRTAGKGWQHWTMQRLTDAAKNQDVWEITDIVAATRVNGEWVDGAKIKESGAIELAVRVNGDDDFSGGSAHGNQELTSTVLLVDGEEVTIGADATYQCDRLELLMASNLYKRGADPDYFEASPTTMALVHTRWDFQPGGWFDLHHYGDWQGSYLLDYGYVTMLPFPTANYSHLAFSPDFVKTPLPASVVAAAAGETTVKVWGAAGLSIEVEMLSGWPATGDLRVPDKTTKHKIYYSIAGTGSGAGNQVAVDSSTIWRTHARFRIENRN